MWEGWMRMGGCIGRIGGGGRRVGGRGGRERGGGAPTERELEWVLHICNIPEFLKCVLPGVDMT